MIEFALIAALSVDGIAVLALVLGFVAVKIGMLEWSFSVRAIPPRKRGAAEAEGAAQARGTP